MRTFLLYLLLIATLLPTVSPWGIIAHYQLNKDYIARVLCENRDRPDLHCDGQCYLARRLKAQQDKQDKETTERVQKTPSVQLFWDDLLSFLFPPLVRPEQPKPLFTYTVGLYAVWLSPLFQPPGSRA